MRRTLLYFAIPIILILIVRWVALVFHPYLQKWTWIPVALAYWGIIAVVLTKYGGDRKNLLRNWFKKSNGYIGLKVLSILIGLSPLPVLLLHYHLFDSFILIVLWAFFAIVNPFFEETFWRGFMLDFSRIKIVYKIIISSVFFTLSHPLMWGVFSIGMFSYVALASIFLMGLIWSLTFAKTKSLVWPYISHVIVDVLNISILIFMNIYVPKW